MGTRGIPARYGGFETFAEQLATRLVARGHAVTVYGRRGFLEPKSPDQSCRGVTVRITPTFRHKYLETPVHALTSFLDLFRRSFDVVLLCNAANSPCAFLVKLRKLPLLINVDGIERNRTKWNLLGKAWYLLGEKASVLFATRVIADAKVIADYYEERYGITTEVIAYGAEAVMRPAGATLEKFGLTSRKYLLYVSRLEPENNALGVIEAYKKTDMRMPLVVVGDAPYADSYKESLRSAAQGVTVIFTGFQFGEAYQEFQSNCMAYIQATEVGGTHPALIESMAYGNCILANGTPENIEVLGDSGIIYSKNNFDELGGKLQHLMSDNGQVEVSRAKAKDRAEKLYLWDAITDKYEKLLLDVARHDVAQ